MKPDSVKKNYIYNAAFQFLLLMAPLITTPYVSRVLGAENVGKYSFAESIVTYFTIFAIFGTGTFGQREVAFHRDSKEMISQTFWNVLCLRFILSTVGFGGYLLYLTLSGVDTAMPYILLLNLVNVVLDISWFFTGIEKFKQVVLRNLVIKLISVALIFTIVKKPGDLWLYALILCGSAVLGNMSMWVSLPGRIGFVKKLYPFYHFKEIIAVFIPTIAIQVYVVLDKSMIGWITNSDYANGCYEQSEKIARVALKVITAVCGVVFSRVANLYNNGHQDEAKSYVYKACRLVWCLSLPIMFGLIATAPVLIPVFLGDGYEDAILLLSIFSLLVVFVSLAGTTGVAYLVSTNQQKIYTISVTVAAAVNLVMNSILIPRFSATGAAIGSISAEFIGCAIQIAYCCMKRQLSLKSIFGGFFKYLIAGIVMFSLVFVTRNFVEISVWGLLLLIVEGAVSYFVIVLILRDEFVLQQLKSVLKRK